MTVKVKVCLCVCVCVCVCVCLLFFDGGAREGFTIFALMHTHGIHRSELTVPKT